MNGPLRVALAGGGRRGRRPRWAVVLFARGHRPAASAVASRFAGSGTAARPSIERLAVRRHAATSTQAVHVAGRYGYSRSAIHGGTRCGDRAGDAATRSTVARRGGRRTDRRGRHVDPSRDATGSCGSPRCAWPDGHSRRRLDSDAPALRRRRASTACRADVVIDGQPGRLSGPTADEIEATVDRRRARLSWSRCSRPGRRSRTGAPGSTPSWPRWTLRADDRHRSAPMRVRAPSPSP